MIPLSTLSSKRIQGDAKVASIDNPPPWVAIGRQFRHCPGVLTLGVRPSFAEYESWEKELLFSGRTIYFPTQRFIEILHSSGIPTYPNWRYYQYIGNKFKQTLLFQALDIPHPRTRFYWGARKAGGITDDFSFPFIAKIGKGSSKGRGVFLIRSQSDLDAYCKTNRYAYIQEYIHIRQSARVVLLNGHIIKAYWLEAGEESFLTNLHQGGNISRKPVPENILEMARMVAVKCGFDEVGLDIIQNGDTCYVLEANMAFGTKGLEESGMNLSQIRCDMLLKGLI